MGRPLIVKPSTAFSGAVARSVGVVVVNEALTGLALGQVGQARPARREVDAGLLEHVGDPGVAGQADLAPRRQRPARAKQHGRVSLPSSTRPSPVAEFQRHVGEVVDGEHAPAVDVDRIALGHAGVVRAAVAGRSHTTVMSAPW